MQKNRTRHLHHVAPAAALFVAACASAPQTLPHGSAITPPDRLDAPQAAASTAAVSLDRWWESWNDPALNALVVRALAANGDLKTAEAHVKAARALVSVSESALHPMVAANAAAWGTVSNADIDGRLGEIIDPYTKGDTGGGYLAGFSARWEPDVFGGRRADVAASRALADSAELATGALRLVVIGDVVENYQQLQGIERRLAILDEALATAKRLRTYAKGRFDAGQATGADVTKADNAIETLNATRPPLTMLRDVRLRRLAVLCGDLPEKMPAVPLAANFAIPAAPSGQFPSAILERRPDVLARGKIVEAREARLKSLRSDLMPRFGISFLGQSGHLSLSGLPGFGGQGGLVGVSATVPIFTGGLLRGRIAAGDAELEAAWSAYDQTLLGALEEVESSYGVRSGLDRRLDRLGVATGLAERRAKEAEQLYRSGRMTLGDVLGLWLEALEGRDTVEQGRIAQGTATVQLFRALGGGWQDTPPG